MCVSHVFENSIIDGNNYNKYDEIGKIICVVGPTASGKSNLAVKIARAFDGEVISCDSMQLYKGMDIGTAKANDEEMEGVPHHLLDILDIEEDFCVSDYVRLADEASRKVRGKGKLPVFCGGTGLYIDSFVSGIEFGEYENLPEYRAELEEYARVNGSKSLHCLLEECDPVSAANIEPANVKRVIRALEVYKATGEPISLWNKRAVENARPKEALYIGIAFRDRKKLYDRIDRRVDIMMENGIVEEARQLCELGLRNSKTAGQAIGYKEFYPYFDNEATLEECVERLKINSRHYAKRQLTWFNRNKSINWVYPDDDMEGGYVNYALDLCEKFLAK